MLKRLFCLISAFAVLFFVSVPVGATGMEIGGSGTGIPVVANINFDVVDFFEYFDNSVYGAERYIANTVGHFIDEDICPNAPQLGGGHNFVPRRTLVDGQVGRYNVCEYCGRAYGDVCEEAYEQYVDTLPGIKVDSSGAFYWTPEYKGMRISFSSGSSSVTLVSPLAVANGGLSAGSNGKLPGATGTAVENCVLAGDEHSGYFVPRNGASYFSLPASFSQYEWFWYDFTYPVSGYYSLCRFFQSSWKSALDGSEHISYYPDEPTVFHSAGSSDGLKSYYGLVHNKAGGSYFSSFSSSYFSFVYCDPVFKVVPLEGLSGSSFSADTRVDGSGNSVTGLYGYMDNGTLVQSAADTIFTESGNVYTNPVTNETKNVTSWDYDYTDRSYTLTTNEGDEVTVTYGDTNVTINEGENTYNVYYLVEHDDNVQCAHTYSSQVTQSPTCTGAGVRTYTCSSCGNSYTQEIPASGHDYAANVTTAPTCSASGVRTFTCTECGDTYTQAIPATGHDYVSSVTQEATCTGTGVRTSVCSVCGDSHTETIAAIGHSYSSEITTAPTCTETGVRTFTCSVCGDVRTESVPATGHNYSSEVTMQPTCTTTGVRTFTCSSCGDSYTRSIPATGHRWRILQTVPSQYGADGQLTQAGYTLYQCETCNEQYRIDAASSGSELPMASSDGTSTGDVLSGEVVDTVDSHVGKGFLATIAHGLTEDLPEVLHSFSTWFVEFPRYYSSFTLFLKDGIFVCLPVDCQRLIEFGFGMVTAVGIIRKIIGR